MNTVKLSHLNVLGGKLFIESHKADAFLVQYARDVQQAAHKQMTLNEIMTPHSPFFLDVDYITYDHSLEEMQQPEAQNTINEWISIIAETITSVIKQDESKLPVAINLSTTDSVHLFRDNIPATHSVVCTAPIRMVTKKGQMAVKIGIHIVWPKLIIDKATAQQLREISIVNLFEHDRKIDWNTVIDDAVYRPNSCLRMLYSYRGKQCHSCSENNKSEYLKTKSAALKYLKLKQGTFSDVKAAYDSMVRQQKPVPKSVQSFITVSQEQNCSVCHNKQKVPDIAAGYYSVQSVRDGTGSILSHITEAVKKDVYASLYIASIHRPDTVELTELNVSEDAPAVVKFTDDMDVDGDSDASTRPLTRKYTLTTEEGSVKFSRVNFEPSDSAITSIEEFLRTEKSVWGNIQIAQLIKLASRSKGDQSKMADGSADYILIATPRGYGSRSCCIANRIHSSNHIYFVLDSHANIHQKCHSSECNGKSIKMNFETSVYCELFPYSKKTMAVPAFEVQNWLSGKITPEYIKKQYRMVSITKSDGGKQFTMQLRNYRRREATRQKPTIIAMQKKATKKRSIETVTANTDGDEFDFDGYD